MKILVCLLLAAGALAAPFSVKKETERCPRTSRFHVGRQFVYNYEGETVSGIIGASSARSALKIKARVFIETVGLCQHVLKIDSVELWEAQGKTSLRYRLSEGSSAFAVELQAQELAFNSHEGSITDLRPHSDESTQALNVKKGILSALQAQFVDKDKVVDEVDVAGSCRVNYTVRSRHFSGRVKKLLKTRNLTECSERSKTNIGIHTEPYPSQRSFSLLKSTGNCQYIINAKHRIQKVRCVEKHIFRPFSAGHKNDSGAITTTIQSLNLLGHRKNKVLTRAKPGSRVVSLRFEHPDSQATSSQIEDVEKNFINLARQSVKETKPGSARLFSRLVYGLRKLHPKAMEYIWERIFDCDRHGVCRPEEKEKFQAYLFDALPHCGSEGCAKVMSSAIRSNMVGGERGNMFLAGLAMVSVPSQEMIGHVLDLCRVNPSRMAMLTLGTIIHKFCEKEPNQCKQTEGHLRNALLWLEQQIGDRCDASSPEQFEHILMALKAIGNAGRPSSALNKVIECSVNDDAPMNVSVAALEALRRFPCTKERANRLLTVYSESSFDVERRIAAYLALMKCPSPEIFQSIATTLSHEVSKQVGSFVWTHLTNAMESTEPVHGKPLANMIKKALVGKKLREFNLGRMRFSRAYEGSAYSDLLEVGGSGQGHLIFHPSSYFPRSAMLNLTVDVLGVSTNILETAARFEGFEMLLEQFFGPEGLYPDKKIMDMFNLRPHEERENEERDIISNLPLRGRRSIQDDINNVERNLKKLHQKMDTRKHNPAGSLSVKLFGNEMRLASFDDINWIQTEADNVNMVDYLIKLARGGKKTYSKSFMFLDADTTVPTILGLPLRLDAKGTTVASLELNGKFDIRNMFWGPMNFDVRGYIRPSAVVEINGRMGVDAVFAEAGIMLNSSMYSATEIKGNATYKQGETLKFELGVPQKPVQIINVTSTLYTTLNDEVQKIDGTPRRVSPSPCLNATRVLGITVCGRMSLPLALRDYESPFFPLSGPATLSLVLSPTDKKLTKYQFLAKRIPTEDENELEITSRFSTPGATWEREFEANGTLWLKKEDKYLSLSMGALGYKFGKIEGRYNNVSHSVNLSFTSRDVLYGHPIVLNAQYFNMTEGFKREIGLRWSATYKNYTVGQLHKIYNSSSTYGLFTNTTYWPQKHFVAEAELSVPNKHLIFNANHTCTKTSIKFHGKLGQKYNSFKFNFSNKPTRLGVLVDGKYLKNSNKATMKVNIQPLNQKFSVDGKYVKVGHERGVFFKASHDNKNRVFTWYTGIVNGTKEKTMKSNATVFGRRAQVALTYFNLTNENGFKFNILAMNKTMETVWSYVKFGGQKNLKFNASGFDKKAHATFSFLNLGNERAIRFNGGAMNNNVEAMWSFAKLHKEKVLKFNMTVMNKKVEARWSLINYTKDMALKFNATAMNKSLVAMWTCHHSSPRHRHIKFNATSPYGRKVEMMWSYNVGHHERSLKFNATALNKNVEAVACYRESSKLRMVDFNATVLNRTATVLWALDNSTAEKVLKLNATAASKTVLATLNFVSLLDLKAIKFNGTALNKTILATWTFVNRTQEKSINFNGKAFNKSIAVALSFFNYTNEKAVKLNGTAFNESIEAMWSYEKSQVYSHVRFNGTLLGKKVGMILSCEKQNKERIVRLNVTGLKKTFELKSKFSSLGKARSMNLMAAFQNYSIAVDSDFINSAEGKIGCMSVKHLDNEYGSACITLVDKKLEKTLVFNGTIMNRSMEAKTQLFKTPTEWTNLLRVQYDRKTLWESSISLIHRKELNVIRMNATVAQRSLDVLVFFENRMDERSVGFNMSAFGKAAGIKASWYNIQNLNEARMDMLWNKEKISSVSITISNLKHRKAATFKLRVLNWLAEQKGEYLNLEKGRRQDFILISILRRGSELLFSKEHSFTYRNTGAAKDLMYNFNAKLKERRFIYGWEVKYRDDSNTDVSHHEIKVSAMYSRNKKVSLTTSLHNDSNQMAGKMFVEYLPGQTMQHSLVWEKQRKLATLTWEILPKVPMVYRVYWTTNNGFSVTSDLNAIGRRMVSYFRYFKDSGHFDGRLEICPKYPIIFNGMYLRENGLDFLIQIHAFKRTWNHKIEVNKKMQRIYISVELFPKVPVTLEATYDHSEGFRITTELSAFKKSIQWEGMYQKVTKSLTSELSFLNQKLFVLERFDVATKTLVLQFNTMNRTLGFVGRFDWKNFAASAHVQYQKSLAGWSLTMNRDKRNIIFNVTLTPRFSGQVVAEMPTENHLQVTVQRKFGFSTVNESRFLYELDPTMSRLAFTYNTTTIEKTVSVLNAMIMKNYDMTQIHANNLTKELQIILKNAVVKIRPQALEFYNQVSRFDYKTLMKNVSMMARNFTFKALNLSRHTCKIAAEKFPTLLSNVTTSCEKIYKQLKIQIPKIVKSITFHLKNVTPHLRNVTLQLKNIGSQVAEHFEDVGRDLKLWAKNVTIMVRGISISNHKVEDLVKALVQNITVEYNKLAIKIENLATTINKAGVELENVVTFNSRIVYKNVTAQMQKIYKSVLKNITVQLKEAYNNVALEVRAAYLKFRQMEIGKQKVGYTIDKAVFYVENFTRRIDAACTLRNLTKFAHFLKLKIRDIFVVKKNFEEHVIFFNHQALNVKKVLYPWFRKINNVTVLRVAIGQIMDRLVLRTIEALKRIQKTITTDLNLAMEFINETSKKSLEEIVDVIIMKTKLWLNHAKPLLNDTLKHSYDIATRALESFNVTIRDIANQVRALDLGRHWKKLIVTLRTVRNIDFNKRLSLVKHRIASITHNVLYHSRDIMNITIRAFNLTRHMVTMKITQRELVNELMAIANQTEDVAKKHLHNVKNIVMGVPYMKYWNSSLYFALLCRSTTVNTTVEMYVAVRKHALKWFNEHRTDIVEVYDFYNDLITDFYKDLNGSLLKRVRSSIKQINATLDKYVWELRKYENMTFEQIAFKTMNLTVAVYNITRNFGLTLYKNYTTKVVRLYNQTRKMYLVVYNRTLVMMNSTKTIALDYYKHSKIMAIQCCNSTAKLFFGAHNVTLKAYNVSRYYTLKGFEYLNKTVLPKVLEAYGKGLYLLQKTTDRGIIVTKAGIHNIKVWYEDNKENTIEELFHKVYLFGSTSIHDTAAQLKFGAKEANLKLKELKLKLVELKTKVTNNMNLYVEKWNSTIMKNIEVWNATIVKNLKIWNATIMNITKELLSVYNQTANVSLIAGKQLVLVFKPSFTSLKKKTFPYLVAIEKFTMPIIEKARNITLVQLDVVKNYSIAVHKNVSNCHKFKAFVAKYEIKQKIDKVIEHITKTCEKLMKYVRESKPKIEAEVRKFIVYQLPELAREKILEYKMTFLGLKQKYEDKLMQLKEKYHPKLLELRQKCRQQYQVIVANPMAFVEKLYNDVYFKVHEYIMEIKATLKNSSIERIIQHEIWSKLIEEVKRHEFAEIGKEVASFSNDKGDLFYKLLVHVAREVELKADELLKKTNATIQQKFRKLKLALTEIKLNLEKVGQYKLRNVVEHEYVFKTIAFANNVTLQTWSMPSVARNYLLVVRNLSMKLVALGKEYGKNLTALSKAQYKNLTMIINGHYKNLTIVAENYSLVVTGYCKNVTLIVKNFTALAKNTTLRYWNNTFNCFKGKLDAYKILVSKALKKGLKLYHENTVPYYKNSILPVLENKVLPMYRNYSKMTTMLYSKYAKLLKDYYLVVRSGAKLTIRESMMEVHRAIMVAYSRSLNITLRAADLTNGAVNITLKKWNIYKVHLKTMMNHTLKTVWERAKFYTPLFATIKKEMFETAIFLNKYHGIEERLRKKVLEEIEFYGPRLMNKAVRGSFDFANKTIGYANRTLRNLNATMVKLFKEYRPKYNSIVRSYKQAFLQMKQKYTVKFRHLVMEYNQKVLEMSQKFKLQFKKVEKQFKQIVLQLGGKCHQVLQQSWNRTKETVVYVKTQLERLCQAIPQYVLLKKGELVLLIPHPFRIEGNIKSVILHEAQRVRNLTQQVMNMTRHAIDMTKVFGLKMLDRSKLTYARTLNTTLMIYGRGLNSIKLMYAMAVKKTLEHYGQAVSKTMMLYGGALKRGRLMYFEVYGRVYRAILKAHNSSKSCPFLQRVSITSAHYLDVTSKFAKSFNFHQIMKHKKDSARTYVHFFFNVTKMYAHGGYDIGKKFTRKITKLTLDATSDIMNSPSLDVAYHKALNYSHQLHYETLRLYHQLFNETLIRYRQLSRKSVQMIGRVRNHQTTIRYQRLGSDYYGHSMRMMQGRLHRVINAHRQFKQRVHHAMNKVTRLFNPLVWIPPFESTAMIFGRPHVYTFDGKYYKFPGYELPECTYVLARDVLNDKFTILSQKDALILVTKDANIKIHGDGRVESITKITKDGTKIGYGYASELPVETANTTVVRDTTYVTLKHDLGVEIKCNVKRNLCTFNIAKWYHGRMMGLLGTNNNEDHDEMLKPNNKLAKDIYDFVNSWEVTKNEQCRVAARTAKKPICRTKHMLRCRQVFKDKKSPFAKFFKTIDPRPFLRACEYDYTDCQDRSPKDLKHCNTSAAYVEALRKRGEFVSFLPECSGCSRKVGHSWFVGGSKMVDVVLLVSEGPGMRSFSRRLPDFVKHLSQDLPKYSFRFGLVGFGGKGLHDEPHMVTMQGKIFGTPTDVRKGLNHLHFDDSKENGTSDGVEAAAFALRNYNFRAGATKIFLLVSSTERRPVPYSPLWHTSNMLQQYDITLNVLGRYQKLRADLIGMDSIGRVYRRKVTKGINQGVHLPSGDYMSLVQATRGSVFGLNFFASDKWSKYAAVQQASAKVWKEQIKKDQAICKECVCISTRGGQGVTYCRNNPYHTC